MDPVRFDQLSKHVATRLSRRSAVQWLGAGAAAGALLSVRQQQAAADCRDAWMHCGLPASGGGRYDQGAAGYYGRCWNWSTFTCELCAGALDAASRACNETYPGCLGRCVANIYY
jgi:hypothetical protein